MTVPLYTCSWERSFSYYFLGSIKLLYAPLFESFAGLNMKDRQSGVGKKDKDRRKLEKGAELICGEQFYNQLKRIFFYVLNDVFKNSNFDEFQWSFTSLWCTKMVLIKHTEDISSEQKTC